MDITRENLEKTLKIHMDKLKFKLCLNSYENTDYEIRLSDHIASDGLILKGDIVTIKIQTDLFLGAIAAEKKAKELGKKTHSRELIEFNKLLEQMLHLVPRMFHTIAETPVADVLAYSKEKKKFKRYTYKTFEKAFPPSKYEKQINTTVDFRATIIHFKSGFVVRRHGRDAGSAVDAARRRMFELLDTETSTEDDAIKIDESHEDIIFDILLWTKDFTKEEKETLIRKLSE